MTATSKTRHALLALCAVLASVGLAIVTGAEAKPSPKPRVESGLRAFEDAILGPEHAAEHAELRHDMRRAGHAWRNDTPAQRSQARQRWRARNRAIAKHSAATAAAAGGPAKVGQWTTAPFQISNYAIHATMLPTGKVLFWGYSPLPETGPRENDGHAALWDPSKGTGPGSLTVLSLPHIDVAGDGNAETAPLYCASQSMLPSGEVLIAGGNFKWIGSDPNFTDFSGSRLLLTFNPWTETFRRQPDMEAGRWYPGQVELADGRTVIASGFTGASPGGILNPRVEVFTPAKKRGGVGRLTEEKTARRRIVLYPHLILLPSGFVGLAGPGRRDGAVLNTKGFTWDDIDHAGIHDKLDRVGGNTVVLPKRHGGRRGSWRVLQMGGYDIRHTPGDDHPATKTTETLDFSHAHPKWEPAKPQKVARSYENTVLLPDSSMITVGGGKGFYGAQIGGFTTYPDGRARQVELYDPHTGRWHLGPAQQEDRAYHSTALLLPDGRVWSAGDDYHPEDPTAPGGRNRSDTAEIYSPPYLFHGRRPVIKHAPAKLNYGDEFAVASKSRRVVRAVLMAPSAVTHGADMQQRYVPLRMLKNARGHGVHLAAPPRPQLAPPGYYMLFLLSKRGVPSVASWVHLRPETKQPPGKKN